MIKKRTIAKILLLCGDFVLLYAALGATLFLRYYQNPDWQIIRQHLIPFTAIFLLWLILFGAFGLYDLKFMRNSKRFLYRLLQAEAANMIAAILILYAILPVIVIEPRRNLLLVALIGVALIFAWRSLFNLLIIRTKGSRIMFFGVTREALELANFLLKHPQLGQKPVAFMSANGNGTASSLPLPGLESGGEIPHFVADQNITSLIKNLGVDTVVILREIKENKTLVKLLFEALPLGISVAEFPAFHEAMTGKIPLSMVGEIWFLENLIGTKKPFYDFFKRGLDLATALILTIPAFLLFPLIAAAIKLDSEGPIFYRQKRVGRHGKEFGVFKYRSMVKDAEKMSGLKETEKDPRHTRVGPFLRRSYLDELPQIINIVAGEISFVGPRPERPEHIKELKEKVPFYEMRLLATPGITGWAQIHMENDASVEDAPEKMQYDLYYVKHRSFVLDLLIILRTIFIILRREGR
ncbi:MAG: sugar transferase [Candidatus Sungbacteria bacterium]|nr:sugar transferase [Candidatus Sungbacteria bacterium]